MMKKIRFTMLSAAATLMAIVSSAFAAPATLTQSVTYNGETITMQLTKENIRGANFELLAQNSTGTYDTITPVEERSYIGTVTEYPAAVSYGILQDDGQFKGGVIFDRGDCWYVFNNGVTSTSTVAQPTSFGYSSWTVNPGQGGSKVYGFDVGIDARYEYFNERGGGSLDKTLEIIEFSLTQSRALYLHDAMLRPFLARVIVRTDPTQDPAAGLTGGTYLDAVKNEWNNNQTDADRDVVAGISTSHVWAGLAWVNVIASNLAYSVNDSQGDGNFNKVWQHELGHNWGLSHYDGGAPEAGTINSNNHFARMSGPEVHKVLNQRNAKLWALDDLGPLTTVNIPPYASYDSRVFTQVVDSQLVIDVLANDHDANAHALNILSFDSVSVKGGTITQQGQNLVYTAHGNYQGIDSFTYVVQDSSGQTATGAVAINVVIPAEDPGSAITIANHSFESGPSTGVPTDWTLTAGSSTNLGAATGSTTDGAKFLWIGPGAELTQDLGYTLTEGEKLTLRYASDRNKDRTIQLLAKSGGVYTVIAEATADTGWAGWASDIEFKHTVATAATGQELAIRIISNGWNQFDNFRLYSVKGANAPSPFNGASDVVSQTVRWESGVEATENQVYVGTSAAAVAAATTASPEYRGSTTNSAFKASLADSTTYFWRVDTVTSSATFTGTVWSFTTGTVKIGNSIAVNFKEANNQNFAGGQLIGPTSLNSSGWNAVLGASGTQATLIDNAGDATSASLQWSSQNVWFNNDGTGDDQHKLSTGYLDDGSGVNVTINNIPYANYKVYGLIGSDQNGGGSAGTVNFNVNGNWALGGNASTTAATWGTINSNNSANGSYWTEIVPGSVQGNYWVVESSGSTCTIAGELKNGSNRGSLAAVIIERIDTVSSNAAPVANDATFSVSEDATIGSSVGTVSASNSDSGDTLSYAITAGNSGEAFIINANSGAVTTNAALNYETVSQYVLSVTVSDNGTPVLSDTATITVNITNVNSSPVWNADPLVKADAAEGSAYSGNIAGDASDPDGDALTFSKVNGPAWLAIAGDGTLSGTPAAGDVGVNQWSVTATDSGSLSASTTLRITVAALPSSPVNYGPTGQTTTYGIVASGGTNEVLTSDNSYQLLQEESTGGKPSNRVSRLQHTVSFDIGTGGSAVALEVEAHHDANSEGDDFIFSWSSDGTNFTDVITVTKTADDDQVQSATLPANLTGQVWIRVRDADRTAGNSSLEQIHIDRLNLVVTP